MSDFDRYNKEFYISTKNFSIDKVLKSYQLPNFEKLHTMVCGESFAGEFEDAKLYTDAESIDYFKYEKALWNLEKPKT